MILKGKKMIKTPSYYERRERERFISDVKVVIIMTIIAICCSPIAYAIGLSLK